MTTETKQEIAVSTKPRAEVAEPRPLQMLNPLEEMERLFDRLMPRSWMQPMGWNWPTWSAFEEALETTRVPHMDVIDRDKDILVRVEVPGVEKKDVDISISDNTLNIKGGVCREAKEQRKDYFRCEIACGNFFRSLALPSGVDTAKIAACLKDGILEVTLPKEASAQRRSVEVK